jgi:hypothetical protein
MWKWVTFFLLFLGLAPFSLAEEKHSYQYITLNGDEETVWSNGLDPGADEDGSRIAANQVVGRDCSALTYEITLFTPCEGEDSKRLWRQTKIIAVSGIGVVFIISLLPNDISKWDDSKYDSEKVLKGWYDNVRAGPVWDDDKWYLNIIGHTYFGGVYYQAARKSGYNQWNSFTYSALMSTFYYEYGIEALAEVPSIQDLVITPIGGWIYGEWAYHKEKEIIANGGRALGSEFWGSIALFFLDPVGKFDDWIGGGNKVEVTAFSLAHWPARQQSNEVNAAKDYWGVKLSLQF